MLGVVVAKGATSQHFLLQDGQMSRKPKPLPTGNCYRVVAWGGAAPPAPLPTSQSLALGCSSPGTPMLGAVTRVSICSAGICWMLSAAPSQLLKCPMTNPVADGESKGLSKYPEPSGRKGLPALCPAFIYCCRPPVPCSVYPLQRQNYAIAPFYRCGN